MNNTQRLSSPSERVKQIISEAVQHLRDGHIILYPTDTVWGIGCDATNEAAVAKVYEIKRRSEAKSLVLIANNLDMVARYVKEIPSIAIDLVDVNDDPMTIIYPNGQYLAPNVLAEDGSIAIRIPFVPEEVGPGDSGAAFCRELAYRFRKPLVSTSANVSGEDTPKNFSEISSEIIDAVDYVVPRFLDKGSKGKSSQILKVGLGGEIEIIRK